MAWTPSGVTGVGTSLGESLHESQQSNLGLFRFSKALLLLAREPTPDRGVTPRIALEESIHQRVYVEKDARQQHCAKNESERLPPGIEGFEGTEDFQSVGIERQHAHIEGRKEENDREEGAHYRLPK